MHLQEELSLHLCPCQKALRPGIAQTCASPAFTPAARPKHCYIAILHCRTRAEPFECQRCPSVCLAPYASLAQSSAGMHTQQQPLDDVNHYGRTAQRALPHQLPSYMTTDACTSSSLTTSCNSPRGKNGVCNCSPSSAAFLYGPSKRSARSTRQSMTSTKLAGTFLLLRPGVLGSLGSLGSLSPLSLGVLPPFPGSSPPGSPGGPPAPAWWCLFGQEALWALLSSPHAHSDPKQRQG